VFPVAGLSAGYPLAAGYLSMRLPLAVTVHRDRYDDAHLGAAVDAYDTGRNARYAIPREQQRSPEIFGHATVYGWSEDKARQATTPEGQSFPAYLRACGFNFE
jgi:FMN reductase [NAD(P)H]